MDGLCAVDIILAPHTSSPEDQVDGAEIAVIFASLMGNCVVSSRGSGGIATGAGNVLVAIPHLCRCKGVGKRSSKLRKESLFRKARKPSVDCEIVYTNCNLRRYRFPHPHTRKRRLQGPD